MRTRLVSYIPIVGAISSSSERRERPLIPKLIESSLPGVAVALILMYANGKVNDTEINNLKGQIVQLTIDMKMRDDKHEAFQMMVMGKLLTIEGEMKNGVVR